MLKVHTETLSSKIAGKSILILGEILNRRLEALAIKECSRQASLCRLQLGGPDYNQLAT